MLKMWVIYLPKPHHSICYLLNMNPSSKRYRVHVALYLGNDCCLFITFIDQVIDKIIQSLFNEISAVSNGVVEISEPNTEQSLFNEISAVSNGVVEISEPNTEAIDKEEQHAEEKATEPSKPIDCIVNDQWIAKQREKTSEKYIGNTKCCQKLRDERKFDGF
ncbi:uncharacterized protein A4U43_C07F4760 [Asparagus officinalis]|uniref:Uncharacterized protein n=1 Tax=Asparagus officinalis TaxID=4686 RepID=A0A5P1E9T3_ASPOF|nr:uncharacterized protein A4U43_C07F4760 [Asparagus officinalis]